MIRLRWRLRLRRATQDGALLGERVWRLRFGWPRLPEFGERWRDLATCLSALLLACAPWLFAAVASADTAADPAERPAPEFNLRRSPLPPEPVYIPPPPPPLPEPPKTDPAAPTAQAVNYQVNFPKDLADVTQEGERLLARVGDTMHYYPLDEVHVVGYADDDEPGARALAEARAAAVATRLIERYGLKAERVHKDTKVVDYEAPRAEIYIVEGGQ